MRLGLTANVIGWKKEAHIFSSGCFCWSAKEVRRFGGVPSRMPGAVDASESKETLETTLSSDSIRLQLGRVSDFAFSWRFSSRREERTALRGFVQLKLNHDAILGSVATAWPPDLHLSVLAERPFLGRFCASLTLGYLRCRRHD